MGLVDSLFGGGGDTKTKNVTRPWLKRPYLQNYLPWAEDIYGREAEPFQFFPGQTYADLSPYTEQALQGTASRATAGSPIVGQAQDYTGDVLSGQYLDPTSNPFFAGVSDAVLSEVMPAVNQQFAAAGRGGTSPLAAEAMGRGVSRGLAPFLAGEYGRERGIMEGAAARAPGLAEYDYADLNRLLGVGGAYQTQEQLGIDEARARHEFEQQEEQQRLAALGGVYSGAGSVSTVSQQQPNVNPFLALTGAALGGVNTAASLGWQPFAPSTPQPFMMPPTQYPYGYT